MSTSLQLIAVAQERGLITKEAAERVHERREQLVKQAMHKVASELVQSIKTAGVLGNIVDSVRRIGHEAPKPIEKAEGFFSKLKRGAATGEPGKAGWGDVVGNLGKMLALAGLSAGATAGVQGIMRHSRDKKLNNEIQSSYKQMFDEYPKLHDMEERHPGRIQRHFGVLSQFAPSLAAVPSVAGAFVQSTGQMEQIDVGQIKNLAETQTRIDEMNSNRHGIRGVSQLNPGNLAAKAMHI